MYYLKGDEPVDPVVVEPIQEWFEPVALEDFPEGLPNVQETQGHKAKPKSDEKQSQGWLARIKGWMLIVLGLFLLFLILITGISVCINAYLDDGFGKWCCSFTGIGILLLWVMAIFSNPSIFIVPGGFVRRSTKLFKSRYWVTSYDRARSLMMIVTLPGIELEELDIVVVSRKGRKPIWLGDDENGIKWRSLLAAWFSPLPAPTGDKLDDLR